ncbi:FmdB family zinc ribbon protein [Desulfobacca acetoxidans]
MPIYEYQCDVCGQVIEEWQKFTDGPLTTCKHCGGKLSRLISHSSFHLKGGGWYVSDYGHAKPGSAPSSSESSSVEKKAEAPSAAGPAQKSDA